MGNKLNLLTLFEKTKTNFCLQKVFGLNECKRQIGVAESFRIDKKGKKSLMVQEDVEAEEQRKTPQMQILERADKSLEKNNKNLFFF